METKTFSPQRRKPNEILRQATQFYCGIDLHTKKMYLFILDAAGEVMLHRNIRTDPEVFLNAVKPFREDIVVAAECMFTWYWIADLCAEQVKGVIKGVKSSVDQ